MLYKKEYIHYLKELVHASSFVNFKLKIDGISPCNELIFEEGVK